MNRLLAVTSAALMTFASQAMADGFYHIFGSHGDKWGEISFVNTRGNDTVWVWPNEEGQTTFYIHNPNGSRGDWSNGTYEGYYTVDVPDEILRPCSNSISDPYGNIVKDWGTTRMTWTSADGFDLQMWRCGQTLELDVDARYATGQSSSDFVVPTSAKLILQSYEIPVTIYDPAYTIYGLDKNPGIHLEVEFSDGSKGDHDYQKFSASNIIFDDVTGDPNDLIEIKYWDIDPNNPGLGKYAAQLTSTGNGVGTAQLLVSFRDAPHVTASVTATVVSAGDPMDAPVSASLSLRAYKLPLNRSDRAHTVSKLNMVQPIYVSASFEDGTSVDHHYQRDFSHNIIVDDVSGDPHNLIEVVQWPIDSTNSALGTYAGQIKATGLGVGTAYLQISFRNAPGVTSSIAVEVVSGRQ